ncbi:MAG: hypothetical protein AAF581_16360 [Planctomycetota bacterium]
MADEARVTIPGYQPVAGLGRTPSYGVWVRAIQTRLDRHVLLKILPLSAPEAQSFFDREIAAQVRLDGHGVLRVIDEGAAAPVRYLVVDEAGAEPLWESRPTPEDWLRVAGELEELYERTSSAGFALLPIPRESMRMLPSGHFTVADLGWVVAIDDPLPQHPRVPKELQGQPAAAAHNRHFLGVTLRELASAVPGCPRPLRAAAAQLERVGGGDGAAPPRLIRDLEPPAGRLPLPATLAIVAVVLLAAVFAFRFIGGDPRGPGDGNTEPVVVTGGNEQVADPSGAGSSDTSHETTTAAAEAAAAALEQRRQRELEAETRWSEIFGEGDDEPLPSLLEVGMTASLEQLRADFPDTAPAGRAQFVLRVVAATVEEAAWDWWRPRRERAAEVLATGNFARADAILAEDSPMLLPAAVAAERTVLRDQCRAGTAVARAALTEQAEAFRRVRDYAGAVAHITDKSQSLPDEPAGWADSALQSLHAERDLYERTVLDLAAARRTAFAHSMGGDWDAAVAAVPDVPPIFEKLAATAAALASLLGQAQVTASKVESVLSTAASTRKKVDVELRQVGAENVSVKGTVLSNEPVSFRLKLAGKTTTRECPWRQQTVPSLAALASVTDVEACLLLAFLGELERAVVFASSLTPPPQWLPHVEGFATAARGETISRLLREAEALYEDSRWEELAAAVDEVLALLTNQELKSRRGMLSRWLHGYWLHKGPGAAFTGATDSTWEEATETLTLQYDFKEESALSDWGVGARTQCEIKRRALLMQGALTLAPASMWPQPGGTSIFVENLEVRLAVKADRRVPNVNVVLWANRGARRNGVIAGLGFQPPGRHSIQGADGKVVLLPANVLGQSRLLETGRASARAFLSPTPKVRSATIQLLASARGTRYRLVWDGHLDREVEFPGDASPRGTVELRSYTSPIGVRSLQVTGKVRAQWFEAWRKLRIVEQLKAR